MDEAMWQKCPDCGGHGTVRIWQHEGEDKIYECKMCRGEGHIPSLLAFADEHYDFKVETADLLDTTPEAAGIILNQLYDLVEENA